MMNSVDDFSTQSNPPHKSQSIADVAARVTHDVTEKSLAYRAAALANPGETITTSPASDGDRIHGNPTSSVPSSPPLLLELWPTMARLAIAGGAGPQFRLWCYLAQVSRETGGIEWLAWNKKVQQVCASVLGVTPATIRNLARSGVGGFWQIKGGVLWRFGAPRVYRNLSEWAREAGVSGWDEPNRRKVFIPLECLASLERFYAVSLHAWLCAFKDSQLSNIWRELTKLWKRSRQQLNKWLDMEGVQRIENFGVKCLGTEKRHGFFDVVEDSQSGNPQLIYESGGRLWLMFQRGNTYVGRLPRAAQGAYASLNAQRGTLLAGRSGDEPDGVQRWATNEARANFTSDEQYRRAKHIPEVSHVLKKQEVLTAGRIRARRVWLCYAMEGGTPLKHEIAQ